MSRRRRHQHSHMSARDALDMADDIGLPDGAAMAYAAEMAGLDYDGFIDELVSGDYGPQEASVRYPEVKTPKAVEKKIGALGCVLVRHDAYHRTVRRDGKVMADWWPHKRKFRVAGDIRHGDADEFVRMLAQVCTKSSSAIEVTTRHGGTTDADIEDRERDNIANGQG
jgi:hypothetical protein